MSSRDYTREFDALKDDLQIEESDQMDSLCEELNELSQKDVENNSNNQMYSTTTSRDLGSPSSVEAVKNTGNFIVQMNFENSTCSKENCYSETDSRKNEAKPGMSTLAPPIALKRRQIIRGRKCPLPRFHTRKGAAAPKHEYFVAMIIRSFKKALRSVLEHGYRCPKGGIFTVLRQNAAALRKWEEFASQVDDMRCFLIQAAKTEDGPETDGKTQRKGTEAKYKSFNKQFMRNFFDSPNVRVVFYYFSEFVFTVNPEELCTATKYMCCAGDHTTECSALWNSLKNYAQDAMIMELDLDPFFP